jgi:hypothetical protein
MLSKLEWTGTGKKQQNSDEQARGVMLISNKFTFFLTTGREDTPLALVKIGIGHLDATSVQDGIQVPLSNFRNLRLARILRYSNILGILYCLLGGRIIS